MSVIGQEKGIKHGTTAGYKQHLYRKVPACEPCLQAERDNNKLRKPARGSAASKSLKPVGGRARRTNSDTTADDGWSMGVVHSDTAREPALTYIPFEDEHGLRARRRERVKAALTCLLLAPEPALVIEALGVPADEAALARSVHQQLAQVEQGGAR